MKMLNDLPDELREKIIQTHLSNFKGRGLPVTKSVSSGFYGQIYIINHPQAPIVAKCPKFREFSNAQQKKDYVLKVVEEFSKSLSYYHNPFINRVFEIELIHNWPFLFWRFQEGTLADLIAAPKGWSFSQKHAVLIMIIEGLLRARGHGLTSHQDLKPDNIFVTDISRRIIEFDKVVQSRSAIDRFRPAIADFATADAFLDQGKMAGSNPYKAPEQHKSRPDTELHNLQKIDDFAMCVIACEVFSDGLHPLGVRTQDVWPKDTGPYKREHKWKEWARRSVKVLPDFDVPIPDNLAQILLSGMCPDPEERPSLEDIQAALWESLKSHNLTAADNLRLSIESLLSFYQQKGWPYLDERLIQIRQHYANDVDWTA